MNAHKKRPLHQIARSLRENRSSIQYASNAVPFEHAHMGKTSMRGLDYKLVTRERENAWREAVRKEDKWRITPS